MGFVFELVLSGLVRSILDRLGYFETLLYLTGSSQDRIAAARTERSRRNRLVSFVGDLN